ncbi:hypothetical protein MUU48_10170 [Scandinavium sp. H11S7]|uniref:hypothetical protein n=1 Tax=Scandinavium hiltneri TaxID=2926519 RepID=UPI00216614DA|nr:hypothetical protein [Scandinavium hiltneri]MCS2157276.1 hypothetical protein [Scandinavium hiltneri]
MPFTHSLNQSLVKSRDSSVDRENLASGREDIKKQAYLYSHFSGPEALERIIFINAKRIANGKSPMRVIVSSQSRKTELERLLREVLSVTARTGKSEQNTRLKMIKYMFECEKASRIPSSSFRPFVPFFRNIISALDINKMQISALNQNNPLPSLSPSLSKIYIIGHGSAQLDFLSKDSFGSKKVSYVDLVWLLNKYGLPKDYQDIRLLCCHSGDNERFSQLGFPVGEYQEYASAQKLADEFAKLGFTHISVTGYRGVYRRNDILSLHKTFSMTDMKGDEWQGRGSEHRYRFIPKART